MLYTSTIKLGANIFLSSIEEMPNLEEKLVSFADDCDSVQV